MSTLDHATQFCIVSRRWRVVNRVTIHGMSDILVYVLFNFMHPQLIYNRYFMRDKSALICFEANVILNRSYWRRKYQNVCTLDDYERSRDYKDKHDMI